MQQEHPEPSGTERAQQRLQHAVERLRVLVVRPTLRPLQNVNALFQQELSAGDWVAIWAARWIGSWGFILVHTLVLFTWAGWNVVGWLNHWDPYPFIMMGLFLALESAYTAPLIIMAQNREAAKDRLMLQEDYETNQRAAEEIQRVVNILEQHSHLLELLEERRESPLPLQGLGEHPGLSNNAAHTDAAPR